MIEHVLAADHVLRAWVVGHRVDALDGVVWGLSAIGRGGLVWLAIAGILAALGRLRPQDLVQLALALLLATLVTDSVLKPLVGRERPFVRMPAAAVIGGRPHDGSFPSGHTANAFAGALTLSGIAPPPRLVWWTLAAAIAYSRVYLGVHYPLDVVGGALVGAGCAALVMMAGARWRRRRFHDAGRVRL